MIQPSFSLSSVASLENVSNSHQSSFPTWITPGSTQPSFSLPSVLSQALVLGRSSSTPGPSTLTLPEPGNVDRVRPSFLVLMMPQSNQPLFSLPSVQPKALVPVRHGLRLDYLPQLSSLCRNLLALVF